MKQELLNTLILAGCFLGLFALAELIYHTLKVKAEYTRKLVHFGTGLLTLLFPILLDNHWLVLALCASFALILLVSLRFKLLQSINAIDRKSHGSISYPLAVYISYIAYDWGRANLAAFENGYILFYLPVLILAICDPIAALCGKRWQYGKYKVGSETKTLMGSGMFLLSAWIVSICLFLLLQHAGFSFSLLLASLVIAIITAVVEAFSRKGLDNLFIPLSTILSLYLTSKLFF